MEASDIQDKSSDFVLICHPSRKMWKMDLSRIFLKVHFIIISFYGGGQRKGFKLKMIAFHDLKHIMARGKDEKN